MTSQLPIAGRARKITAGELSALLSEKAMLESAENTARSMVQAAHAEAQALRERAAAEWDAHQERIKDVADSQLTRFVDETRVEKGAEAMLGLMRTAARVRRDFDDMEPWLTELVMSSVTKIVGSLPNDKKWRGILTTGLAAVRDRWALTLQCAPSDAEVIEKLRKQHPELMESIKEVQTDVRLPEGSCLLINANGVIDAAVETKLTALKEVLSQILRAKSEA